MVAVGPYDDTWLDDKGREWTACHECGGEGFYDGECTCMDDTCCCAEPDPPTCTLCRGTGSLPVTSHVGGEAS